MTLPRFALVIVGLALFASCQLSGPTDPAPVAAACGASELDHAIGTRVSEIDVSEQTRTVRVIAPNAAVTLDHRPERLNVHVDEGGLITKFTCG